MNKNYDNVILGGGLTGLSLAYHFDRDLPVFEMQSVVGGLIRTVPQGLYRFDLAPHLLHFRSDEIKDLVLNELGVKVAAHRRKSMIYFRNKLMPYPFELNLYQTPDEVRDDCLAGLSEVSSDVRSNENEMRSGSYANYALQAFGPGISNHYLLPYNEKLWATPPTEMTCEWMRFLPTADLDKIHKNAFEPNDDSFGYNTSFYYPTENGIQDLADAFARRLTNVNLNERATGVDLEAKAISFASGKTVGYKRLVSTIPLKSLASLSQKPDLIALSDNLINTTVHVVNVVIRGEVPEGVHWAYFPESDIVFYRVSFPKNYFDGSAPDGQHIISVEVGRRQPESDLEGLTRRVIDDIRKQPIFTVDEVIDTYVETIPHAYCIYDAKRTPSVNRLLKAFAEHDVISTGRYGRWEYSAMEDAIVYGKDLAEEFKTGTLV
jgi:protoporphyrinogen oxidase